MITTPRRAAFLLPPSDRVRPAARYGVVAAAWLVALALTLGVAPQLERANFVFFWVAVLFAAWYGGFRPALLAAVASVVAVHYFLVPPLREFGPLRAGEFLTFGIFVIAALLVSALAASLAGVHRQATRQAEELRAANAALRARQGEIEDQAIELEQQMEEARALADELDRTNGALQRAVDAAERARSDAEEARSRVATILDALADVVVAYDAEWRYRYLNPAARAALRALGAEPALAPGRVVWDVVPALRGTPFEAETRRAVAESRVVEYTEYLPALERWYENRVVPGADGGVTTFARDVTARRRAEEAERTAADRARRLLAVTTGLGAATTPEEVADVIFRDGLAAVGADAGSLALLRPVDGAELEVVRTHGYSAELTADYRRFPLTAGRPLSDAVLTRAPRLIASLDEWRTHYPTFDARVLAMGYEAYAAIPVVSGGRVLGAVSASFRNPVDFDDGTRTFLASLGEQCGLALERARAYDAEQRARRASAFLAETSRLLTASLDYAETLRTLAEAAVPALGDWCAVDVVRDPAHPVWPPALDRVAVVHRDPAMVALGMELTARYPTDWSAETGTPAVLRDGRPLFIPAVSDAMVAAGARDEGHLALLRALRFSAIIVVPLRARGLTLGMLTLCMSDSGRRYDEADLALAEDLAQRAATAVDNARLYRDAQIARAEAEAANRAKSEFLSTMSHELRTPLNAIAGYAELLEMGVRGPISDPQRVDLVRLRRSAKVLMALVNDVLNFARVEAGRVDFRVEDVRLDRALADLEVLVAPQVEAKGVRYTFAGCAEPLVVRADADRLKQILTNLLTNAIKFTPPGGAITVSCAVAAGGATTRVSVADTGRGVAPDQLERIFEPFVQVDRHLSPESQQGVGLGLAISRELARGMGAELTAESTPGEGSIFTVTLPVAGD